MTWKLSKDGESIISAMTGRTIGYAVMPKNLPFDKALKEQKRNASMMTKANEMYAMLERLLPKLEVNNLLTDRDNVEKLLKEARGEA